MTKTDVGVDAAARLIALRDRLLALHRYTITSEGASPGYFRLVEDPHGCWVQWPEVDGLITALLRPQREETKEEATTDDPRNRASVLRSETEPTR